MTVVLDTCAIVRAVSEPEQLSARAVSLFEADDTEVCVSAISCAEIACAAERGRIAIDRHWRLWFRHYVELNDWTVLPVDLRSVGEHDMRRYLESVLAPLFRVQPSLRLYRASLDIQSRYRFAYYDALIVAAALDAGCATLYSEDLQDGQRIDGLTVVDPFRTRTEP